MWLLIHAGIKVNSYWQKGPLESCTFLGACHTARKELSSLPCVIHFACESAFIIVNKETKCLHFLITIIFIRKTTPFIHTCEDDCHSIFCTRSVDKFPDNALPAWDVDPRNFFSKSRLPAFVPERAGPVINRSLVTDERNHQNKRELAGWLQTKHCLAALRGRGNTPVPWNENVVILTKFSSLATLEVVILTTSGVVFDNFQCSGWEIFHQNDSLPFQCNLVCTMSLWNVLFWKRTKVRFIIWIRCLKVYEFPSQRWDGVCVKTSLYWITRPFGSEPGRRFRYAIVQGELQR